ncbi:hypothetical protein HanIR_Chr08g0364391 [Helianthus annuus]|nr:hypothetical protein HanIR_Chr08g0364391 [Helianthus annuus]
MALTSLAICNHKMDFVPVFTKPPTQPTSLYFSKMKIRSFSSSSFEDPSTLLNKQVEVMTDSTNIEKVIEGVNMMVTLEGTIVGVVSLGAMLLAREAASKTQQMEPVPAGSALRICVPGSSSKKCALRP